MSSITLLVIFIIIAMISLIVVSAVNERQTRSRLIGRKLVQMKRRVDDLEEMAVTLDGLVDSPEIARHVNEEVIDLISGMIRLDPESQSLFVIKNTAEQLAEEFRNPNRPREIYRLQESDSAIARTLFLLNETGRILRKRQAAGKLEMAEMEALINDLAWAHMMVGVVSNIGHGHKALNRGDVLKAYAFYKKAQQVAMQTSISDDRRHEIIKEIGELMTNQRKALSEEYMPENHYNPKPDTESLPSSMLNNT
ncbi:hypothetical protein [Teredinibacter purpureus]|nr:hypothetical protein [Teredinibacter purpureus]